MEYHDTTALYWMYTIVEFVSSKNGNHMNTQLLITTLQEAIHRYYPEAGLILHSDQGSQFTSNTFTDYCKKDTYSKV